MKRHRPLAEPPATPGPGRREAESREPGAREPRARGQRAENPAPESREPGAREQRTLRPRAESPGAESRDPGAREPRPESLGIGVSAYPWNRRRGTVDGCPGPGGLEPGESGLTCATGGG